MTSGLRGLFVGVGDAGELLDLAEPRLAIAALRITLLAHLHGVFHVDLDEPPDHLPALFADVAVGRNRGGDVRHAVLGEQRAHPSDAPDVGVPIFTAEPQPFAEVGAHEVGPADEQDR